MFDIYGDPCEGPFDYGPPVGNKCRKEVSKKMMDANDLGYTDLGDIFNASHTMYMLRYIDDTLRILDAPIGAICAGVEFDEWHYIIRRPCHILVSGNIHNMRSTMEYNYMKLHKRLFEIIDKEVVEVKKYNDPRYDIGQVIDIKCGASENGLPERIMVLSFFMNSRDKEWLYRVRKESTGGVTNMRESYIDNIILRKDSPVYNLAVIQRRYMAGFRFCGNFQEKDADTRAKCIAANRWAESVRLTEAYFPDGRPAIGQIAVWLRYKAPILAAEECTEGNYQFERVVK